MSEDSRSQTDDGTDAERHPTDEEQVESEWHFWLLAIVLVGGIVLVVVPQADWSGLGFVLVGVAVLGWLAKTLVEGSMR